MTGGPATEQPADSATADDERAEAATAFQRLGNETRVDIVRQLSADGPRSFSALFEASDSESSAGFAYHLRQLGDQFARQREDERWELTTAGREAARAVRAGSFTGSVDHEAVHLDEACPLCREAELTLSVSDSIADVTCSACEQSVLRLSFPPSGHVRDESGLPGALDTYHRNRISTFADGVCPDCGGRVETAPEAVSPDGTDDERDEQDLTAAQFGCECTRCTASLDCPVTLAVLDHPAVVSFYDDHGEDVTERPVWNVGPEWRERVLSTEPWCFLVSTRLDDEVLELYVGGDGTVHEHRRRTCSEEAGVAAERDAAAESAELGDDAAA